MLSIEHHLVKRLLFKNIVNDLATKEVRGKCSQCVFFPMQMKYVIFVPLFRNCVCYQLSTDNLKALK